MKLGLGTAQFGMDYGVSNEAGMTSPGEVAEILAVARAASVKVIDTAPAYGEAESVLGAEGVDGFDVVTKTEPGATADEIEGHLERSLMRLRCSSIYGLISHRAEDLVGIHGATRRDALERLRSDGRVAKVGVSVYSPSQIELVLREFEPDLVQLPLNVFDQRAIKDGALDALVERDVEVHVRSAFLQGLLLMGEDTIPRYFAPWRRHIEAYGAWLESQRLSPTHAALGFAVGVGGVDTVVVGVSTAAQLEELLEAGEPLDASIFSNFAVDDEQLVNPSLWEVGS